MATQHVRYVRGAFKGEHIIINGKLRKANQCKVSINTNPKEL